MSESGIAYELDQERLQSARLCRELGSMRIERDTIKAKLAEYEAVHAWCDKNVDSAVFYKMMGNQWFVHNRSQKQYKSTTLYLALKSAWEGRDK